MDKKKIYIIIIVLCVVVTAGVLYYGFFSQPKVEPIPVSNNVLTPSGSPTPDQSGASGDTSGIPTLSSGITYTAPSVFPQNSKIDESVFSSAKFRSLQDYVPLTVSPEEMGRDNPFAPYSGN